LEPQAGPELVPEGPFLQVPSSIVAEKAELPNHETADEVSGLERTASQASAPALPPVVMMADRKEASSQADATTQRVKETKPVAKKRQQHAVGGESISPGCKNFKELGNILKQTLTWLFGD
jgi:hypothetical protein